MPEVSCCCKGREFPHTKALCKKCVHYIEVPVTNWKTALQEAISSLKESELLLQEHTLRQRKVQ